MKKKICILFCICLAAFSLCACSSGKGIEYDQDTLEQATEVLIQYCASADEQTIEQWQSMTDFQLEYQLMQSGLPFTPDGFLGALEAWPAAVEECGAYEGHGDFQITAGKDEIEVTTMGEFADRDAEITVVYDGNSRLDSLSVSAEYTTGEILQKSGMNTILGMGTVFVVLIFISIVISLMKYIPAICEKLQRKPEKEQQSVRETVPEEISDEEILPDADEELIAVIAAAVAAAEGSGSTDGFVVRSIKRRPSNKWKA
nr:OadG family transporter subunit [uncultured Merdimonas sp.]